MAGFALLLAAAVASAAHVRELVAHDQWKEAVAEATELASAHPGPDETTALGEALYRAGRIDEAGKTLAPLVDAGAPPARALAQLGLVRAAAGRDDDARKLLEGALAKSPDDPWVIYHASEAAATRAKAIELLNAYVARSEGEDPDRVEGARGTIRLYTALGERKVWVPVARPERLEIPLRPMVGGGGYVLEATLAKKKKIRLLLDTGSTGLFVVARAVEKGGYSPLSEETVFAGGGSGRTKSGRGLLETIDFGGLSFSSALVTTSTAEFDPQGRIHGVLGLNVFSGYRVTLDLAKGRLLLEPSSSSESGAAYWEVGGQILVRADAQGGAGGLFLLDTGATRTMLDRAFASGLVGASTGASAAVRTYGGDVAGASIVRGVSLKFLDAAAGRDVFNCSDLTQRSRLGGVQVSGFLGLDLLDGRKIVVDTVARRVDLLPAKPGS